jgi:wyosine [tRNA(Phe)-imidazoG37] synthetase (radical SAM superfamily)
MVSDVIDAPQKAAPRRSYFGNRFVYLLLSARAKGLSLGVNLNPDKHCNFNCVYCEVDRSQTDASSRFDLGAMQTELEEMLAFIRHNTVRELDGFAAMPDELLHLKEVAVSGDGEPTLSPDFQDAIHTVLFVRSKEIVPFFKIVLITNGTGLNLPAVQRTVRLLTSKDEIWVKLDVGREEDFQRINGPKDVSLQDILQNILDLGRQRPIVIQSLFPDVDGIQPSEAEVAAYVERLKDLKAAGAQISLVQIYSVHRQPVRTDCHHLPLSHLTTIARRVRDLGLRAEVF